MRLYQFKIMKGDKITACIIGKKIDFLTDGVDRPDYEEKEIQVINIENDQLYGKVIQKWDPNVFVTFGEWEDHKFLSAAPYNIRKKWINLPIDTPNDKIGLAIYKSDVNFTSIGQIYK